MLQLRGITKKYGSNLALDDVSIDVAPGEVHAVLGENGAGKSTLMKIAYGLVPSDRGTIKRDGAMGMVHQHFTCIDSLTVAENIALAAGWPVRPKVMNSKAQELAERLGLPLDPTVLAGDLSAGLKQRLELLKALATDARILLLDEPTSVLAPPEAESLLALIGDLKARGIAIVFITHKLDEALAIADRITVLRRGRITLTAARGEVNRAQLVAGIVGSTDDTDVKDDGTDSMSVESVSAVDQSVPPVESVALAVPRLAQSGSGLHDATFTLRAGELVGVAAVEGSGQRELFRGIAGLVPLSAGSLVVNGRVAFIPEDRTREGMIPEFTLAENLALVMGSEAPWVRKGWMDWGAAERRIDELVVEFDVRTGERGERIGGPRNGTGKVRLANLSGGNQQKVVVAAALERKPAVLLAENPTRGLDIKASAAVLGRLRQAARQGVAVLVHLPDLDELLPLVDRVMVLNGGRLRELPPEASREEVGTAMVSAQR
ncbi:MAG TPA: ATP-binding cassette domain-containing protein [Gemmatimonadales bacterium]|nr:ATP-binding cassette domain-containing protein [Gemmatimonadales bacterium]